jgi:hypothetical protein
VKQLVEHVVALRVDSSLAVYSSQAFGDALLSPKLELDHGSSFSIVDCKDQKTRALREKLFKKRHVQETHQRSNI